MSGPPTALCILTCVPAEAGDGVGCRLSLAISSLETTDYAGPVVIVDDASTAPVHLRYLELLAERGYQVVRRPTRGGIARAKNTCLRVLNELNCEVGFI